MTNNQSIVIQWADAPPPVRSLRFEEPHLNRRGIVLALLISAALWAAIIFCVVMALRNL